MDGIVLTLFRNANISGYCCREQNQDRTVCHNHTEQVQSTATYDLSNVFIELSHLYASKSARELTLQLNCHFEKPEKESQRYQAAGYRNLIPRGDHWYNNGVLKDLEQWRVSRERSVFVAYGPYGGVGSLFPDLTFRVVNPSVIRSH